MEVSEIELERIKVAFMQEVHPFLMDTSVEWRREFITEKLVMIVRGYIWGETSRVPSIEYPADWWQAFKARWFPRWALRRWPVLLMRHETTLRTLYPSFHISMPSQAHVLKIDRFTKTVQAE